MAKKKRLILKDKAVKDVLRKGGRKGAKRIFFELLKRAARPVDA